VLRRILSVSRNYGLLLTRNDLLAVAGYSVASPRDPADAPVLFRSERFDAVLIGDSVLPPERKRIIEDLRSIRSGIPILYLFADPGRKHEPFADESVDVTGSPEPLLTALERHIKLRGRKAA